MLKNNINTVENTEKYIAIKNNKLSVHVSMKRCEIVRQQYHEIGQWLLKNL